MYITENGMVPVHWWTHAKNFGDLLSPWLVRKITGREVCFADHFQVNYSVIGSILGHTTSNSIVWGTGAFGVEQIRGKNPRAFKQFSAMAKYCAVRGPLTRNLLAVKGVECPRIYGDPALLVSKYYTPLHFPDREKYEVGLVLRWSEKDRMKGDLDPRIKLIYLDTDEIETILDTFCSCKKILTTSLHGLIIADAYGIPNGWLSSDSPTGLEFKYWDYLISVAKVRKPFLMDLAELPMMGLDHMLERIVFDARKVDIDLELLLDSCPFLPGKDAYEVVPNFRIRRKWWSFRHEFLEQSTR
jgi:pyruvyltransferase